MMVQGLFECSGCGSRFSLTYEKGLSQVCPSCKSGNISCIREDALQMGADGGGCSGCGCGHHS